MSRKTTSNPDPRPHIGAAIYSEFGIYIDALVKRSKLLMTRHPKALFSLMILSILVSAFLAFSIRPKKRTIRPITTSIFLKEQDRGKLVKTALDLKTVWYLSIKVDSLMKKQRLNARDSIVLQQAFKDMERFQFAPAVKSNLDEHLSPIH